MYETNGLGAKILSIIKYIAIIFVAVIASCAASFRILDISGLSNTQKSRIELISRISELEKELESIPKESTYKEIETVVPSPLAGKKIVYDGDSIAASREHNSGGYAKLIANETNGMYENFAEGGARLCSSDEYHSVVDNLMNLADDGDLYCFEGGINDFWANTPIGECDVSDYTCELDTNTICGAMETIFRYCMEHFSGKPICFVIVHKIQDTAVLQNGNGDTFEDYRNAMISVCQKYSVPYYDAFMESGLNGWNQAQNELFLTANKEGISDGIHPNEEGYKRYYVPQLIDLFEKIMPVE